MLLHRSHKGRAWDKSHIRYLRQIAFYKLYSLADPFASFASLSHCAEPPLSLCILRKQEENLPSDAYTVSHKKVLLRMYECSGNFMQLFWRTLFSFVEGRCEKETVIASVLASVLAVLASDGYFSRSFDASVRWKPYVQEQPPTLKYLALFQGFFKPSEAGDTKLHFRTFGIGDRTFFWA